MTSNITSTIASRVNKAILHRRLGSDPIVALADGGFLVRHNRSPTCPTFMLREVDIQFDPQNAEKASLRTLDTEQLTGSIEESAFDAKPIIGRDILVEEARSDLLVTSGQCQMNCCEVYASLGGQINLDMFIQVLYDINPNGNNKIQLTDICRYVSENSRSELHRYRLLRHLSVCRTLLSSLSFYIAIMYTIAGAFFTIGACGNTGLSNFKIQNMFLSASCLYLCGSAYSLCQAWKDANAEWANLQFSRLALQHTAFSEIKSEYEFFTNETEDLFDKMDDKSEGLSNKMDESLQSSVMTTVTEATTDSSLSGHGDLSGPADDIELGIVDDANLNFISVDCT